MSSFPCQDCGTLLEMDPDGPVSCKKCHSKKPFKCTKCGKKIAITSVFHPERLTMASKPIFCMDCGSDVEQVECCQCGISLTRSNGIEIPINGELHVYHKNCYEKQKNLYSRVLPLALIASIALLGYLGFMLGDKAMPGGFIRWGFGFVGAIGGFFVGKSIANVFALK